MSTDKLFSTESERLFLVDGMSQIYRSFFAIRHLSNSQGLPTNALFGFTMMLRKLLKDDKPAYLAVCWDTPEPTFRHVAMPQYKANRAAMPDDLIPQIAYAEKICEALNIKLIKMPGYEADDIIGTLAVKGAEAGLQVVIVSNDKDMGQLVNDNVSIMKWDKTEYALCNAQGVQEWLGVPPHQVVEWLGLMGDATDNVPGAPGIGEKGALLLIQQFGTIEAALQGYAQVTRKTYRESLQNNAPLIRLSRQMVTIDTAVPIDIPLESLKVLPPNSQAAYEIFSELEFNALIREFAEQASPTAKTESAATKLPLDVATHYQTVTTDEDLQALIKRIWASDSISLAITPSPMAMAPDLFKVSLSFAPGGAYQLDFNQFSGDRPTALATLRDIWTNGFIAKSLHDSKQALTIINQAYRHLDSKETLYFEGLANDTLLAAYLIDSEANSYALSSLAQEYLGLSSERIAALDPADLIGRLVPELRARLTKLGLEQLYLDIELPLVNIVYDMEQVGVVVDPNVLAQLSTKFEATIKQLEQEIYLLAGQEFNINSPAQLGEIFEKLNFAVSRKTKTGKISTSGDILEELALKYELPGKIIEYREIAKLKNTYVDALPKLINPSTGRLHTTINQVGTATGRLSSSNPNLQNIPVRSDLGKAIRQAFVASEGYLLLSADYSQIELRLLAHIAQDEKMTEAFQNNEDIHTKTAREVFGAQTEDEMKAKRRVAKATNFGIAYGVGAFGLAQRVGISRSEAKEAIENYYATYTGVRRYMEELPAQGRKEQGVVRTLFGRIRRLPDLNNQNHNLRSRAEREAINAPIQGTAADLVKLAMIKVYQRLKEAHLQTRMLLQVHDELLLEVPPNELDQVKALVKQEMEHVYALNVPLVVDVHTGHNWLELK